MNGLPYLQFVEDVVSELVRSREPLAVGVVQRVDADDPDVVLDVGHSGEVFIERGVLEDDTPRFDDAFDRNRSDLHTEVTQDGSCGLHVLESGSLSRPGLLGTALRERARNQIGNLGLAARGHGFIGQDHVEILVC